MFARPRASSRAAARSSGTRSTATTSRACACDPERQRAGSGAGVQNALGTDQAGEPGDAIAELVCLARGLLGHERGARGEPAPEWIVAAHVPRSRRTRSRASSARRDRSGGALLGDQLEQSADVGPGRQPELISSKEGLRGIRGARFFERGQQVVRTQIGESLAAPGLRRPSEPVEGASGSVGRTLGAKHGAGLAPEAVGDGIVLERTGRRHR